MEAAMQKDECLTASSWRRPSLDCQFTTATNSIIIITRPKPAYGRQGLAGSWGQNTDEVSTFLVFLTSHFAPAALSLDLNQPGTIKIHLESWKPDLENKKPEKPPETMKNRPVNIKTELEPWFTLKTHLEPRKKQPKTLKNNENQLITMKNEPGTLKNHKNWPGTIKNQPETLKKT